jgi:two-component system, sensor histidine kinase PdtaS
MRKLFLGITLCFCWQVVFTQADNIDLLLRSAEENAEKSLDSALYYLEKAGARSFESKNQASIFKVFRTKGMILEDAHQWQSAIDAYLVAKNIAEQSLDDKSKLAIYNDWAIVHKNIKNFKTTQEYHLKSIAIAEKIGNWEAVEANYHGLGTMYSMLSNFPQAIYHYRKSIEAAEKQQNKEGVLISLQNISNVYFKAKDYDAATKKLSESYLLAIELNDSLRIANALKLEGSIALERSSTSLAFEKYQQALYIYQRLNKKDRLAEMNLLISDLWVREKKYPQAATYFAQCEKLKNYFQPYVLADYYNKYAKFLVQIEQKKVAIATFQTALNYSDTARFKEIAYDNHLNLVSLYASQGQFENALHHAQQANFLQKMLNDEGNSRAVSQVELRYELEKKDVELALQRDKINQSNVIHWILGIAALLLFTLLYFTFGQLQAKKKAIAYTQLLLKELNHRVKNNLQNIVSIIRLQSRSIQDVDAKKVVGDCQNRLEAIAALHQQFYQNDDIHKVNFKAFLENLLANISFRQDVASEKITCDIDVDNNSVTIDNALPIALIINELATNSIKHAFHNTANPLINIRIDNNTLHYADNGSFNQQKAMENKNFGYQLIIDLSQQLSAIPSIYANNGFHFELKF